MTGTMRLSTKTYSPAAADIQRGWRVIDATDRPLGRLASEVAAILRGKDKPIYTPHMDTGDFVIVVNASKVRVTGDKPKQKIYYSHSGYPGGLKAVPFERMLSRHPRRVIEYAVWGMLPKNRLGRALLKKLKVYAEETHPHSSQIRDHSRPEKPGKPGRKPPKKIKARREAPAIAVAEEPETLPPVEEAVAEPVADIEAAAPPEEPDVEAAAPVEEEARAAAAPAGKAEPVEAVAEKAPAAEVEPLKPPPARPRSRRARAQQTRGAKATPEEGAAPADAAPEEAPETPVEAETPAAEAEPPKPPPARPRSRRARAKQPRGSDQGQAAESEKPPEAKEE